MDELKDALKTADAWLQRWAEHVGNCAGEGECTCGLTRVRYEVAMALINEENSRG
jgi:hypothetical protein